MEHTMSVRKRVWTAKDRKTKELVTHHAFVCDYLDQDGVRRLKTFPTQTEAKAFAATTTIEVKDGVHVPDRASETVATACDKWLETCEAGKLETTTVDQYRQHSDLHIKPF